MPVWSSPSCKAYPWWRVGVALALGCRCCESSRRARNVPGPQCVTLPDSPRPSSAGSGARPDRGRQRRAWVAAQSWAAVGVLAACAAPSLQWSEAQPQDPDPTGPGYLRNYKESHFRALGDRFVAAWDMPRLHAELRQARVLYLGDHHGDRELHARWLALLADLHRAGVAFDLGLECIGEQDEVVVASYLQGGMGFDAAVRAMVARWPESWLDREVVDSGFYRALLRAAPQWGADVFALEPAPRLPLYERDQTIARKVVARAGQSSRLQVVVVGHTHLLGQGQLVRRVALPHVAMGARLNVSLIEAAERAAFPQGAKFAVANSGVLFCLPLDLRSDQS